MLLGKETEIGQLSCMLRIEVWGRRKDFEQRKAFWFELCMHPELPKALDSGILLKSYKDSHYTLRQIP